MSPNLQTENQVFFMVCCGDLLICYFFQPGMGVFAQEYHRKFSIIVHTLLAVMLVPCQSIVCLGYSILTKQFDMGKEL